MDFASNVGCGTLSKLILQIWLFGLFLHFFGLPALRRYNEQKVIVVKSVRESSGVPVPAVTISVKDKVSGNGWKKQGVEWHPTKVLCKKSNSAEEITECIERLTYNLSEISSGVTLGPGRGFEQKIEDPKWEEDYLHTYAGRIYTLELPIQLDPTSLTHNFFRIGLKRDFKYDLYIHDPKNFYLTVNPEPGFPYVKKVVDPDNLPYYYRLGMTEVEELNVPDDPCNEDPDFNYNQCIKEYISKRVGCRTKWEINSFPLCTNIDDFG